MKRILVAVDQSPRTADVLATASSIARAAGAQLYLFHAIGLPVGLPADAFRASPTELVETLQLASQRDLEQQAATIAPGLVVQAVTRIGAPWSTICAAARDLDVDLVVVGSHGYDAIDHVLGTTAAKVVNHCDRSVLVVRRPKTGHAA